MAEDFEARLAGCFARAFMGFPVEGIPRASMATTPGWDSSATLTLISLIEQEFDCWLGFERAAEMVSFAAVADIVRAKV